MVQGRCRSALEIICLERVSQEQWWGSWGIFVGIKPRRGNLESVYYGVSTGRIVLLSILIKIQGREEAWMCCCALKDRTAIF